MVQGTDSAPFVFLNRTGTAAAETHFLTVKAGAVTGPAAVVLQSLIFFRHAEGFP